jgi:hypothetical protein
MSRDIHFIPDDSNPYAPPSSAIQERATKPDDSSEFRHFLRWEKLRLFYNAILLIETFLILMSFSPKARLLSSIFPCLGLAFLANVCFCLGPVLDGYARWIGLRHEVVTGLIFGLGTLLAMLLTFIAVLSVIDPEFFD